MLSDAANPTPQKRTDPSLSTSANICGSRSIIVSIFTGARKRSFAADCAKSVDAPAVKSTAKSNTFIEKLLTLIFPPCLELVGLQKYLMHLPGSHLSGFPSNFLFSYLPSLCATYMPIEFEQKARFCWVL